MKDVIYEMVSGKMICIKAGLTDLELLTETRITVLKVANQLPDSTDMSEVRGYTRSYCKAYPLPEPGASAFTA